MADNGAWSALQARYATIARGPARLDGGRRTAAPTGGRLGAGLRLWGTDERQTVLPDGAPAFDADRIGD